MRFAEPLVERLEVSKVRSTKGNGPDAANIRPAKKYDFNAADFRATTSPIPAFFSPVSVNCDVADVADVAALIHKGFLLQRHDFSDVADVAASAGYVLNLQFSVCIHTNNDGFIQKSYESIQSPRHFGRAGAGTGQQFSRHAKLSFSCDRIRSGAEKHHGFGDPIVKAQHPRPSLVSGFSFFIPCCAGRTVSFTAGRVGTPVRVCRFLDPVRQPRTSCHLHLAMRWQFSHCRQGAFMADIRTPSPTSGTLGYSPAISPNILPRWAYLALALACVVMGLWASYITLQYFEHGAKALEADVALQALAVSAAVMFVASEMGAFALAALLTERQLRARRWGLTAFAAAVLLLEVFTIVAVQLALTVGADMTQTSVSDTATDLQKQIATVEANAKTYAATAESLRAADQLKKAAAQTDKATAEQAKASQLYDRLALARTQKRPTLTGLLGEKTAIAYAVARGVLVSLGGLVFFGVAGALLRAARGGVLSIDQQILQLLHELRGAPGQISELRNSSISAAPSPAPAPALASFKPVGSVAPKDASTGLTYSSKAAMAGAGLLAGAGALTAPITHAAPAVPTQAKAPATPSVAPATGASETVQSGASVSVQSHAPESVQSGASETAPTGASVSVQSGASVSVQSEATKPRVKRAVSAKIDTGTDGKAGARFKRIKAAVKAGKITPSIRGIQAVEGGSQDVVLDYLRQLETEGVIVRNGRGFALVKNGGAA